ncbi:hypothetical protein SAMN06273570_5221 [Candidatus Pantoea floridensis]|uniref:Uncharacterized protein n=1 Tax=Candidatus Pantoea floridensis TaxID=1938870 RepID=A0A286DSI5_9GAMM|nr:hypothetical protein BX596_5261 [Enterobacteriaceae bacterium JKS000233]SOD61636.1 hypothetical protein SAMN06273570_5221 [Pantoea floridensis]
MTSQTRKSYTSPLYGFSEYPLTLAAGHDRACSRMTEEAKRHPDLYFLLTLGCYPQKGVMHIVHRTKF